jgi:hypothetical protein
MNENYSNSDDFQQEKTNEKELRTALSDPFENEWINLLLF